MATTKQVFDLITRQMNATAITNTATTATPPKRRRTSTRFKAAAVTPVKPPSPLDQLAALIEKSDLTVKEIAKRSRVDAVKIQQFLAGDPDVLSDDEMKRIKQAIETVEQIARTARNARRDQRKHRNARG